MKFDRLCCPFVGCYFAAKCDSESRNSVSEARTAVRRHRAQRHKGERALSHTAADPKWMFERD